MSKKQLEKIKVTLPASKNFLIIGSGDPVKTFIKKLNRYFKNSAVFVISDKNCDEAWSTHETDPIESVAKMNNFGIEFVNDINTKEVINKIIKRKCNICFVLGSRWILKKDFINIFKGNIFNYHTSDLPKYQGGGGYRWQIMNRERNIYIAFHQITTEIDQGPVLAAAKRKIKNIEYPKDIFNELYKFTLEYFDILLQKLSREKQFLLAKQNLLESSYFPLLDNNINGAIDLSWSKEDIKLFIKAFSHPYKGAFLFYKNKKIFIKEAKISKRKENFHPFASGLIINKADKFLEIAVNNGSILLKEISDENDKNLPASFFKKGDRLYQPENILIESRMFRPSNKNFILQVSNKK